MRTKFWQGNLMEWGLLEGLGVHMKIIYCDSISLRERIRGLQDTPIAK
jgi:hypothetical protein